MSFIKLYSFLILLSASLVSHSIVDGHEYQFTAGDEAQNASRADLFRQLAEELRCPKCQNQNLADSNAMIAGDLRRELYSQVKDGKNSEEIVDFMVNRYGEFVLYRPALNDKTIALWYGPFVLLGLAAIIFISVIVARKKKSALDPSVATENTNEEQDSEPLSDDEQKRLDDLLNASSTQAKTSNSDDKKGQ